jgi:hypothetical protein
MATHQPIDEGRKRPIGLAFYRQARCRRCAPLRMPESREVCRSCNCEIAEDLSRADFRLAMLGYLPRGRNRSRSVHGRFSPEPVSGRADRMQVARLKAALSVPSRGLLGVMHEAAHRAGMGHDAPGPHS